MAIELIQGDIFDTHNVVIAHGVNCRGGFGSGIAGQIAKKYPKVREEYLKYHNEVGWQLADIQIIGCGELMGPTSTNPNSYYKPRIIVNCATQDAYLPRGVLHANYHAIERVCKKLRHFCKEENHTLALPKIGCGLAGGDWNAVEEIYQNVFHDMDVKVYYL